MLNQIAIGTLLIVTTVIVAAVLIALAVGVLTRSGTWLVKGNGVYKTIVALVGVTIWLIAILTITMWIWAMAFFLLGIFDTIESSLYFSMVAFTTLGFGDVTLPKDWRLLSGFIATNGLILFGLSTAFLIELLSRLRQAQDDSN